MSKHEPRASDALTWAKQHDRWQFLIFLASMSGEDSAEWDRDDWLCTLGNRG